MVKRLLILALLTILPASANPLQGYVDKNQACLEIRRYALFDAIHKPFQGMVTEKVTEPRYLYEKCLAEGKTEEFLQIDAVYNRLRIPQLDPEERKFDADVIKAWPELTGFIDPPPLNMTDIYSTIWNTVNNEWIDRNHDGNLSKEELLVEIGGRFTERHNAVLYLLVKNYDYFARLTNQEQYQGL